VTVKNKYRPKPRFVCEVTKPKIVAMYMNGEQFDPAILNAAVEFRQNHFTVSVTLEEVQELTGMDYPYGAFTDMEIEFVDD
jgi:hypothetical protein